MLAGWGGELGGVGYGESRMGSSVGEQDTRWKERGAWGRVEAGSAGQKRADAVRGAMSVEAVGLAGVDFGGAEEADAVRGARSGEAVGLVGVDSGGAEARGVVRGARSGEAVGLGESGGGIGGAEEEDVVKGVMGGEAAGKTSVDFSGDQFFQCFLDLGAQAGDLVEAREFETLERGWGCGSEVLKRRLGGLVHESRLLLVGFWRYCLILRQLNYS